MLLYLHPGYVDEHYFLGPGQVVLLDRLIRDGEVPPMIVVGPDGFFSGRNRRGEAHSLFVNGVQAHGVSATMKHFVGIEQETDRQTVDENIGERALREIYLKPFEITVKESSPWAVMTGYNSVNGQHADMNDFTLRQVLRGEWGWDGLVMSDWGGVNSTGASIKAGLDLEMPGPTAWRSPEAVRKAINAGEITDKDVDDRTMAILKYLKKLRYFEDPTIPRERAINRPEHQALIRDVASKGIVLLKNEGNILPLPKSKVKGKTIALLGQAKTSFAHGGGSASL
jgi:beta-glucosidase